jgi:hypothetical protein
LISHPVSHVVAPNVCLTIILTDNIAIVKFWPISIKNVIGVNSSEEHRLKILENRVLRRIFGSMRNEIL